MKQEILSISRSKTAHNERICKHRKCYAVGVPLSASFFHSPSHQQPKNLFWVLYELDYEETEENYGEDLLDLLSRRDYNDDNLHGDWDKLDDEYGR